MPDAEGASWDFLTNHARVLLAIARDPTSRISDLAAACHVTYRTAQNIVRDLEHAGYLHRERVGRRTTYTVRPDMALRHPAEAHLDFSDLMELFAAYDRTVGAADRPGDDQAGGSPVAPA